MFTFLVIIHVIVSFVIIGMVLLQAGKGADIGSAFGGSGSQAVFGSMGTPTVLGKITTVVAVVFMVTSFSLAMMGHKRATTIMPASAPGEPAPTPAPAPAATTIPASPALPAPGQK
jgi:preprotein translocase subunit SecG